MPDINLSPFTAEQAAMDRRRKMAEAMQQQAILPIDMPTVPGAKVSHAQGLAKLLQGYIAGRKLDRAEKEQKEYEANTMADFAKIYGLAGQKETVPGAVITPAVPSAPSPENLERQAELQRLNRNHTWQRNYACCTKRSNTRKYGTTSRIVKIKSARGWL